MLKDSYNTRSAGKAVGKLKSVEENHSEEFC